MSRVQELKRVVGRDVADDRLKSSGRDAEEGGAKAGQAACPTVLTSRDVEAEALRSLAHRGFDWMGTMGLGSRLRASWLAGQRSGSSSD